MRERIKHFRQLVRTAFLMLIHAGPWAMTKQAFAWLRGNRRYYRAPEKTAASPRAKLHINRIERVLRRFSRKLFPKTGITYLVALTGSPAELEYAAYTLIEELKRWMAEHPEHEVILIPDGKIWAHIARGARLPILIIDGTPDATFMPGQLFNLGLKAATKPIVAFGLTGVDTQIWLTNAERLAAAFSPASVGVAGRRGESELQQGAITSHRMRWRENGFPDPRYGLAESPSGWLEMLDLIPIHNSVLSREKLLAQGGFSEISAYGFWWQACLALARQGRFTEIDLKPPQARYTLENYPSDRPPLPFDTVARMVVRYHKPDAIRELFADLPQANAGSDRPENLPLRITLLGGPYEPHHNQIFFFNYFRRLEGQGVLSWRVIDDEYATQHDIEQADLVIYTRVRSENGCKLLDYARFCKTPVLYMLDDNWFTMGKEWPEYRDMIAPGLPFYENALYCIRGADAVVTYSPVMKEYLTPHARHIFLQRMPVDMNAFSAPVPARRNGLMIGYAGSPRQGDIAFRALVELAKRHPDVTIFYFGWDLPEILRQIPPAQFKYQQGTHSFADYARTLAALAPDIAFAPLGHTESDRSKNPTKYLDYAAVGCAGIYSNVEPYIHAVKHGQTGLLVDDDSVEAWVNAAETLIADRALLGRIRSQAHEDVRQKYEVGVLMPDFLAMLHRVHRQEL